MRYPRILTCSSARPRYCSCPSAPQHTRSPVRYIRAPGPPNGHATNRDPVNPPRPTYPHASPPPATYNSPTTPAGTGRNQPSSTNNAAVDTGAPIGTTPEPATNGALIAAYTVAPAGPSALIPTRPGAHRPTTSPGPASPPNSNATDSTPSGESTPPADGVCVNT